MVAWMLAMLAWLVGVLMQVRQPTVSGWMWAGCAIAMGGAMLMTGWRYRHSLGALVVVVGMGLLAWGSTTWRAQERLQQGLPESWANETRWVRWQVDSLVDEDLQGLTFEARVLSYADAADHAVHTLPRRLQVRLAGQASGVQLRPGEVWEGELRLRPVNALSNPGTWDGMQWWWSQGVRAVGRGALAQVRHADDAQGDVGVGWIDRGRTWIRERIRMAVADPRMAGLLAGLTIGDQSSIARDDWDIFQRTGIGHLVSISGAHVAMFGWLLARLIQRTWWRLGRLAWHTPSPHAALWGGWLGALIYAVMAGWGVPAQRTVIMLGVLAWSKWTGRPWPGVLVWLLAGVVVVVWDPWSVLAPGFWLSFIAVGVLMTMGQDLERVDERRKSDGQRESWMHTVRSSALALWQTQWRLTLALLPLTLAFFHQASLISWPANLFAIPVFSVLVTPLALLGIVFTPAWWVAEWVLQDTLSVLTHMAAWPLPMLNASWWPAPYAVCAVVAGASLVWPMSWRWRWMLLPVVLPALWMPPRWQPWPEVLPGQFALVGADVGQGTAVLVKTARHHLLFDTGPQTGQSDAGERVLSPMLRTLGVGHLDALVISHADLDHIGGAASLLKALPVHAMFSSLPADHDLIREHQQQHLRAAHASCVAGRTWDWDGVRFTFLHPDESGLREGSGLSDNDRSCVLKIESTQVGHGAWAQRSALLMGDLEAQQERRLVARTAVASLRADWLQVPHHGSRTSSTDELLSAVRPKWAVVQAGAFNRYGHPHPTVLARLQAHGAEVVSSPTCGAHFWHSDRRVGQSCWREMAPAYWQ